MAFHTWATSALRITGRMKPLLGSNMVYMVATLALALGFAHRGLNWIGWAWALGNLASGYSRWRSCPGRRSAEGPVRGGRGGRDDDFEEGGGGVAPGRSGTALPAEPVDRCRRLDGDHLADVLPVEPSRGQERSDRFDAYERQSRLQQAGGLRVRPRSMPRQAGTVVVPPAPPVPTVPPPSAAEETVIMRPINVPESFFRPEPKPPRAEPPPRPEQRVDDHLLAGEPDDDPWRPSGP